MGDDIPNGHVWIKHLCLVWSTATPGLNNKAKNYITIIEFCAVQGANLILLQKKLNTKTMCYIWIEYLVMGYFSIALALSIPEWLVKKQCLT